MASTDIFTVDEDAKCIALVSDLHSDLSLLHRARQKHSTIDHWFCAGDVTDMFKAHYFNEPALRYMSQHAIPSVMGNHDYTVKKQQGEGFASEAARYLEGMPFSIEVEFGDLTIRIYHATPRGCEDFALGGPDVSDETFERLFQELEADIVVLGHTHKPYRRQIGEKLFINPGALCERDGPPTFCLLNRDGKAMIERGTNPA